MQKNIFLSKRRLAVLVLFIVGSFHPSYAVQSEIGGKGKPGPPVSLATHAARNKTPHRVSLEQMYQRAVADAKIAEPDEISKNLTAIAESNKKLIWDGAPGQSHVLVVTWTNWNGYDEYVSLPMTLQREVWVTVVPELRDFCRHRIRNRHSVSLRLKQLLGLPPNDTKTKFVELWADPLDLFRPSPDPEINDYEADLDFPQSKFMMINEEYIKWFNDLKSKSYGDTGYPWTRLGYTYDWGNPKSKVGLSEFVIRAGATVVVHSKSMTEQYCESTPKN
jgi:hypothetical protein